MLFFRSFLYEGSLCCNASYKTQSRFTGDQGNRIWNILDDITEWDLHGFVKNMAVHPVCKNNYDMKGK